MESTLTSGTEINSYNEAQWLAERKHSLGASEIAAAVGMSPWETPVELWQRKVGRRPSQAENLAMRSGKALEPVIAREYQRETGRAILRQQVFLRNPERPWMTATLDGICEDRIVEFKASSFGHGFGKDDDEESVPDHYLCQVQQQMSLAEARVCDLAVLFGMSRLRVYTIERNDAFIQVLTDRAAEFWRCVEGQRPPTWGRENVASLAVLHPECEGEIDLPEGIMWHVGQVKGYRERIKSHEELIQSSNKVILEAMGNAQIGRLADGRKIKRFRQEVAERTQTVKAHTRHYWTEVKEKS